jgi:hypothetical protein
VVARRTGRGGLVERETDPADRRAFRVSLTPWARAFEPVAAEVLANLDSLVRRTLGDARVDELKERLRALTELGLTPTLRRSGSERDAGDCLAPALGPNASVVCARTKYDERFRLVEQQLSSSHASSVGRSSDNEQHAVGEEPAGGSAPAH